MLGSQNGQATPFYSGHVRFKTHFPSSFIVNNRLLLYIIAFQIKLFHDLNRAVFDVNHNCSSGCTAAWGRMGLLEPLAALEGPPGLRELVVAPIRTRVSVRGTVLKFPSRTPAALVRHAPTFGGFIPAPGPTAAVGRVGVAKHRLGSHFRRQNHHRPPPSGPSSVSNRKIVIQNSVLNHESYAILITS